MLKKDYLLAKIGLDTAENEPVKVQITDFSDHMFRSQTVRIVGTQPAAQLAASLGFFEVGAIEIFSQLILAVRQIHRSVSRTICRTRTQVYSMDYSVTESWR